jgi:hypothetical protein
MVIRVANVKASCWILAASAAWFAVEWLPGLTIHPMWPYVPASSPVDWSMVIACGSALAVIIVIAAAAGRKAAAPETGLDDAGPMPGLLPAAK